MDGYSVYESMFIYALGVTMLIVFGSAIGYIIIRYLEGNDFNKSPVTVGDLFEAIMKNEPLPISGHSKDYEAYHSLSRSLTYARVFNVELIEGTCVPLTPEMFKFVYKYSGQYNRELAESFKNKYSAVQITG